MYIREVRQSAENGVAEFRHFSKTGQKAVFSKRQKNPPSVLRRRQEDTKIKITCYKD